MFILYLHIIYTTEAERQCVQGLLSGLSALGSTVTMKGSEADEVNTSLRWP